MVYKKYKFKKKRNKNSEVTENLYNNAKIIDIINKEFDFSFKLESFNKLSFNYAYDIIKDLLSRKNKKKIQLFINEQSLTLKTLYDISKVIGIDPITLVKFFFLKKKIYFFDQNIHKDDIVFLNNLYQNQIVLITKKTLKKKLTHFFSFDKTNLTHKKSQRALVLSVFGDVNSGKTTFISKVLKNVNMIKEIGDITQNVSISSFIINDDKFIFIDTPGHSAFELFRSMTVRFSDLIIVVIDINNTTISSETLKCLKVWKDYSDTVQLLILFNKIDKVSPVKLEKIKNNLISQLPMYVLNNNQYQYCLHSNFNKESINNIKQNHLPIINNIFQPEILERSRTMGEIFTIKKTDAVFFEIYFFLNSKSINNEKIKYINLIKEEISISIHYLEIIFNCLMIARVKDINLNILLKEKKFSFSNKANFKIYKHKKDLLILKNNIISKEKGINIFFIVNDINFIIILSKMLKLYENIAYIGFSTDKINEHKFSTLNIIKDNMEIIIFNNKRLKVCSKLENILNKKKIKYHFFNNIYKIEEYFKNKNNLYNITYKITAKTETLEIFKFKKYTVFGFKLLKGIINKKSYIKSLSSKYIGIKTLQVNRKDCLECKKQNSNIGIVFLMEPKNIVKGDIIEFYEKC